MLAVIIDIAGRRSRHPFGVGALRVGSGPENDVIVDSRLVSRAHLSLTPTPEGIAVEDLGSRNGTHYEGRRLERETLVPPFTLRLGSSVDLSVQDVPSDELALAEGLAGSAAPSVPAPPQGQASRGRETDTRSLPQELLRALAEATDGASALAEIVAGLVDAAAAKAAMVIELGTRGAPVVLNAHGSLTGCPEPPAADLDALFAGPTGVAKLGDAVLVRVPAGSRRVAIVVYSPLRPLSWIDSARGIAVALRLDARHAVQHAPHTPGVRPPFLLSFPGRGTVECTSPIMRALHERMTGALTSDLPVLLTGSTGVGKEIYAWSIHLQSRRANGPLQVVNSSAIPDALLESLLFGAEEGAATGVRKQPGLIRQASGGTFFFDEIGEMGLSLQAKLLRVLDEKRVLPVGGTTPIAVDVRFIAATNRDLRQEIAAGRFREDLYHRLAGHEYRIPDLREHVEDLSLYIRAFLEDECRKAGRAIPGVTVKALRLLQEYPWPGNVRELETTMRRIVHEIRADRPITHDDLPLVVREPSFTSGTASLELEPQLDVVRRRLVLEALEACSRNKSATAARLGMSRGGLRSLMKHLQIGDDEQE